MKKLFLTSGLVLCMACPAFAVQDINANINAQTGEVTSYTLATSGEAPDCSTPDTLLYDNAATTFYAKWSAHQYHVRYNNQAIMQGSTSATGAAVTQNVNFDAPYTVIGVSTAGFAKQGYTFTGWLSDYDLATGDYTPVSDGNNGISQNATSYDLTWLTSNANPVTFKVSEADDDTVDLFAAWTPNKALIALDSALYDSQGVLVKSATNAGTTQVLTRFDNGVYADNATAVTMLSADQITSITKPTLTGYTFNGYKTQKNGAGDLMVSNAGGIEAGLKNLSNGVDPTTAISLANETVYAYWTANGYKLTYDCGGYAQNNRTASFKTGYSGAATDVVFDDTVIASVNPSTMCAMGGYHVAAEEWTCYKVNAEGQYIDSTGAVTENSANYVAVDYTAATGERVVGTWNVPSSVKCTITNWTPNTIGLAWNVGDGATPNTTNQGGATCTYDSTINVAGAPTKAGYDFQGWTTNPDATGAVDPATPNPQPGTGVYAQ